jgi:LmbE family N-acetylglucosaminyl deacetylase
MSEISYKSVACIVAHPDDETLWAGGTILSHPEWKCFVVCLSRKSDAERAEKFQLALKELHSEGLMGDLDDGPEQKPLNEADLERTILALLPKTTFDLVITHHPNGEYTRHRRHEEISQAVITLWENGKIASNELMTFAYEDGNKEYFPKADTKAPVINTLSDENWEQKYWIIREIYGFEANSWEAKTTPRAEAFWRFSDAREAAKWLQHQKMR